VKRREKEINTDLYENIKQIVINSYTNNS